MTRCSLVLAVASALVLSNAASAGERRITGWGTAVDPDGNCEFTLEEGQLTIQAPGPVHDLSETLTLFLHVKLGKLGSFGLPTIEPSSTRHGASRFSQRNGPPNSVKVSIKCQGKTQIVLAHNPHLSGWDAQSGDCLWKAKLLRGYAAPSPVYAGGLVLYALADCGVMGIKPDGQGDVTKSHVAWRMEDTDQAAFPDASSLVSNGELAWFYHNNFLVSTEVKTGKLLYEQDVSEAATFASPTLVGQKLYLFGKTKTLVVQAGREYRLLGTCALEEAVDACPAFAPRRIFIRAEESLYCVGKK